MGEYKFMMDYFPNTVDRKEIDRAFIDYIKKCVVIGGKPLDVFVRKFDTDFKKVRKPCSSIYVSGFSKDQSRQLPFGVEIPISKDYTNNTVKLQKSGTAVIYNYSVDFWADKQTDFNDMNEQWLVANKFSKWFNLPVVDSKGVETTLLCLERSDTVLQMELEENKQADNYRLFHSSQMYGVFTYYEGDVYDLPMVTDVSFKTEVM